MAGITQLIHLHAPIQSRIVDDVRSRIISGEFPPGCQLPSVLEMERNYGTSVITVQRALKHLRKDGFIRTRRGSGSYVTANPPHLCNYAMLVPYTGTPLSLDDARRIVGQWVEHYNTVRLHSAIDYIAPKDKLEGRAQSILAACDFKLAAAREKRRIKRQQMRKNDLLTTGIDGAILPSAGEAEASVAGEHLARNSRPRCDGYPSGGVEQTGSPTLHAARKDIQSIPHAFLNSDLPQASRHLTGGGDLSNSR